MAPEQFTIRQAHRDDATLVADLVLRLLAELGDRLTESQTESQAEIQRARVVALADRWLADDLLHVAFLARDATGSIVGVITVGESQAIYAGGALGTIEEFYVVPEARSSGLGHQLLDEAVRCARERGWQRLEVGAPDAEAWRRTVAFYRREGFVEIGPRLKRRLRPE